MKREITLYTMQEAADILRVSVRTVDRYVRNGLLRSSKNARRRMFTPGHIEEFIRMGEV